jgi:hypothetical protein
MTFTQCVSLLSIHAALCLFRSVLSDCIALIKHLPICSCDEVERNTSLAGRSRDEESYDVPVNSIIECCCFGYVP